MDPVSALLAFSVAAALMTLTPGLDTALVLRTATVEGPRPAMMAGLGIVGGVMAWGIMASLGLGMVLAVSELAYQGLRLAGAAYLIWLGALMLRAALRRPPAACPRDQDRSSPSPAPAPGQGQGRQSRGWLWRGLATNLLNPKVGVFYVSFLPQFIPTGVNTVAFSIGLAAIHAAMGGVWFSVLILATRPFSRLLRHPVVVRAMDGVTGSVLIAFGVRLMLEKRG